jgi:predicted HTH domain antitoxin
MVLTLDLPDDIAKALSVPGDADLSRKALEALAVEGFREKKLSQYQVGQLLGLSRIEAEDLLARHADLYDYDPDELRVEADRLAVLPLTKNRA